MRPVSSRLEAALATTPIANAAPLTAVGIPPSDTDALMDEMRVEVGGVASGGLIIGAEIILRAFDPVMP